MMIRLKQVLHNENGSITIFTLFLLMAAITGIFYLAYYYSGFVSLRQAQNVVDSAALAAVQELRNQFVAKMQDQSLDTVRKFKRQVREEIEQCERERKADDPPCPTANELIRLYIRGTELKYILLANKYDKVEHWLLVVREPRFRSDYTEEKNGDVLYDAFVQNQRLIKQTALDAMEKNNGERKLKITFPVDGQPKLEVNGIKAMPLGELGGGDPALIKARAAAGVYPKEFAVDVSRKIPRTISKSWPSHGE
ncbi:Tad domain-containing protein [Brevibacillus humidisoli]|uniref:Tad domain-containing protein n=1 Tax=Brevibacillus humidisoli TaxID=2895522 RepID=UPI001E597CA3|nr:Tad domain-containing protein [Brevibacillus humidisoli]UFJ40803.1 Tad domain-containing protein [Brevibacillus humidisoli]